MREKFIIYENPILHRTNNGSEITVSDATNAVVHVSPLPTDFYVCDFCNDTIDVQTDEGKPISVFVLNNNNALCWKCTKNVFIQDITLFDTIGFCSCCTDEDSKYYMYIQNNNVWEAIARFNSQEQADKFGEMYSGLTGRELMCLVGELAEPLQTKE